MHDNVFAGRLDFNQYTCLHYLFDALLEVQSPLRYRDKRIIYLGALNSKRLFRTSSEVSDTLCVTFSIG